MALRKITSGPRATLRRDPRQNGAFVIRGTGVPGAFKHEAGRTIGGSFVDDPINSVTSCGIAFRIAWRSCRSPDDGLAAKGPTCVQTRRARARIWRGARDSPLVVSLHAGRAVGRRHGGGDRSSREFRFLSSLSAGTPAAPDHRHAGGERRYASRRRGRRHRAELRRPKPIARPNPRLQGTAATRRTRRCPVDRRGHRLDGDRARTSRGDGHSREDGRRAQRRRRSAPDPRDRYTTFRRLSSSSTRSARSSGVDSLVRRSSSGFSGSS